MAFFSQPLEHAIEQLTKLPGVGRKTAQRFAMYLLKMPEQEVIALGESLGDLKRNIRYCERCFNISETEKCSICNDPRRQTGQICVVADFKELYAIEKTAEFKGRYHVLGGLISPLDDVGPNDLRIRELLTRLQEGERVDEVILALRSSAEGEATAFYLGKLFKPLGVKLSRLASGIPMGADLDYLDDMTLSKALSGRQLVS